MRFVDEAVSFLPFGALEPLRRDLDLTYTQAGLLLALYPGIGIVATPLGVLADHANRRVMAAAGGAGYGAGLLLFAAAGDVTTLVVAVCLMGFAGDALVRAVEVTLVEVAGDDVEPALARANLLGGIGGLAGPLLLAGALATGLGWRAAFVAAGVGVLAYAAVLALVPQPAARPRPEDHAPWRAFVIVARDRRVLRAGLLSVAISAFDEPFFGFAIAYLVTARDVSPVVATLAVVGAVAGDIAASAWAGRTRRRRVGLRVPAAALAAGVAVVVVAPHALVAAAALAIVGAGASLSWTILQARFLTLRPGQAGTTGAVVGAIEQLSLVVPLAIGAIADRRGLTLAMGAYLVAAIVFAVAAGRDTGTVHATSAPDTPGT